MMKRPIIKKATRSLRVRSVTSNRRSVPRIGDSSPASAPAPAGWSLISSPEGHCPLRQPLSRNLLENGWNTQ
ncbi:hypothetical protein J6590_049590 [Homalodisca vitripennis]|nr:hypothetical protein J6590_049590 [Homalodisca vitripennis]